MCEVATKVCNKCKKEKPLTSEYFGALKASEDGFNPTCKLCRQKTQAKYRKSDKGKKTQAKASSKYFKSERGKEKINKIVGKYYKTDKGKEVARATFANRQAMKNALPHPKSSSEWNNVLKGFGGVCAITGKDSFDLEHFIPLSCGHGGSCANNIYPMLSSLNSSKSSKNPFKWAEKNLKGKHYENFLNVAKHLAGLNGMTLKEYRKFVTWCIKNPRTVDQVKEDNERGLTSIDLWKASLVNKEVKAC